MPLTVVPTPVGNLEDMTLRAIRVLRKADVILCEDTRTTSVLTRRYAIRTPLVSYHAHNERSRTESFLRRLLAGENIALVSDAGTPGISDPGACIIAVAIGAGMAGGAGGLMGAIAEFPFTITVLLHAIRREAVKQGYDPDDPWIMAEALRTFGSGSPVAADDGINTAFFSARAALTG